LDWIVTIQAARNDYQEFSVFPLRNLWQNRLFRNNMTTLSRFTLGLTVLGAAAWACAAPPTVTGNKPVVIEVPVPDVEPVPGDPRGQAGQDRGFLAAVLQDDSRPTDSAADSPKERAGQELKRARQQMLKYSSVSANIVETVTVLDKSFKAEGRYLQTALKPNDWHMRLQLMVKLGETTGSLLEVCDGEVLWTRTEIDFGKNRERKERKDTVLTRRNVAEIMGAARRTIDEKNQAVLIASLGLGGLPALLAAIEQDMKFTDVKEDTLRQQPVLVLQGTWTESFASRLRGPSNQPGQAPSSLLPVYVPDAVSVYLDRETSFPHRIVYLKKLPGRKVHRPMLTLDFLDVVLNQPINPGEFDYEPPKGVTPVEQTKAFVDMLVPPDSRTQPGPPLR
jgi:hypothetical protein